MPIYKKCILLFLLFFSVWPLTSAAGDPRWRAKVTNRLGCPVCFPSIHFRHSRVLDSIPSISPDFAVPQLRNPRTFPVTHAVACSLFKSINGWNTLSPNPLFASAANGQKRRLHLSLKISFRDLCKYIKSRPGNKDTQYKVPLTKYHSD